MISAQEHVTMTTVGTIIGAVLGLTIGGAVIGFPAAIASAVLGAIGGPFWVVSVDDEPKREFEITALAVGDAAREAWFSWSGQRPAEVKWTAAGR